MTDSAPPDGLIAKRFSADEPDLADAARKYMYRCLLAGMRGERLPSAGETAGVTPAAGQDVRERTHRHLPLIERIRLGEEPLVARTPEPDPEPPQEVLPF